MIREEKKIKREEKLNIHKNSDYGKSFEQLIIENEKFAYDVVNKEFSKYSWNVRDDLYSAAKFGLVYAATKYDSNQEEAKFISYAVNWIRYYVHEEIRKFNPIKLNQNFVCKRNKINKAIEEYKKEHNGIEPSYEEISKKVGMSPKVVRNVYGLNGGENFNFVSFQSLMNSANSKDEDNGTMMESKLTNEYLEGSDNSGMNEYELKDLLEALKKEVSEEDYNIFVDKHINGMSYSDIAKKYNYNFASSVSYKLKCIEKVCKKLLEG